jgi:uridine kinase
LTLVTGGSGAGKSTVTSLLAERSPGTQVVHLDTYYRPYEECPSLYGRPNVDHPDAFDIPRLERDVCLLLEHGLSVICEGLLVLASSLLRERADLAVFLHAPHSVRFARRIWPTKDSAYEQQILMPMYSQYVEPTMAFADVVILVESTPAVKVADIIASLLRDLVVQQ